jgi:transcriptional regulator with XRE-family HTH domain
VVAKSKTEDPESIAKIIGRNLRRHRRAASLSQEEVADRAGLHRSAVSLVERGGRMPRADTVARVAGAIGISLAEAFEGVHWTFFTDRSGGYFGSPDDERP